MELRVEVDDSMLAFEGVPLDERLQVARAFEAFLAFARQPATYTGGSTEGSLMWVEISGWADSEPDEETVDVLFSRDIPAIDTDGMYAGRWSAGLALRFSAEIGSVLPWPFHLEASIDDPYAVVGAVSREPTTVDEFAQACAEALPQFFALKAESISVWRLQQCG